MYSNDIRKRSSIDDDNSIIIVKVCRCWLLIRYNTVSYIWKSWNFSWLQRLRYVQKTFAHFEWPNCHSERTTEKQDDGEEATRNIDQINKSIYKIITLSFTPVSSERIQCILADIDILFRFISNINCATLFSNLLRHTYQYYCLYQVAYCTTSTTTHNNGSIPILPLNSINCTRYNTRPYLYRSHHGKEIQSKP